MTISLEWRPGSHSEHCGMGIFNQLWTVHCWKSLAQSSFQWSWDHLCGKDLYKLWLCRFKSDLEIIYCIATWSVSYSYLQINLAPTEIRYLFIRNTVWHYRLAFCYLVSTKRDDLLHTRILHRKISWTGLIDFHSYCEKGCLVQITQNVPFAQMQIALLPEQVLTHDFESESQHPKCPSPLVALLSPDLQYKVRLDMFTSSFLQVASCCKPLHRALMTYWWIVFQFSRKGAWRLFT